MIDIKVISRKEAESLKANELPSGAAIISFYDPISPRTPKHIYVLFNNQALCRQFLSQAEWEGFTIDDKKPTEIEWTDALAVQPDKKLCHLGFASRMALHSSQKNIVRIDYEKYINGAKHYTV